MAQGLASAGFATIVLAERLTTYSLRDRNIAPVMASCGPFPVRSYLGLHQLPFVAYGTADSAMPPVQGTNEILAAGLRVPIAGAVVATIITTAGLVTSLVLIARRALDVSHDPWESAGRKQTTSPRRHSVAKPSARDRAR